MARSATAKAASSTRLPRRVPDFVRPYLTRHEVNALLTSIEGDVNAGLLDPSLASALDELRRWVK